MDKYIFGFFLTVLICITNVMSSSSTIFEDHKLQTYSPIKAGVKDLLFEVRVDGLINNLKQTTAITKIEDLYVRFYWVFPGEYRMEVEGLPQGFEGLKGNIKQQIKPFIDMIFSEDFIRQFERSPFVKDAVVKNKYNRKNSKNETTELYITLNSNGIMDAVYSSSPSIKVVSKFDYKLRSWSDGKYVLTGFQINENMNGIINDKNIEVERDVFSGVGLPAKVTVKEEIKQGTNTVTKNDLVLRFSNYHVNSGKAEKYIKDNK